MSTQTQLVVLGGGPGGYRAAFLAADLGLDVTLVEANSRLGGTCLLEGCIPSKALLHVARVMAETREMAAWGVDFGEPHVDLAKMRGRKEKIIGTLEKGLVQLAKRRKVRRVHARGVLVDSQTLQLEGGDPTTYQSKRIAYEHLIVATGSHPVIPKSLQLPSERVMDSSGALALADIPETLLVIGGGYIGLEMGVMYAELGVQVTVVEMTDGLLPGVDRDLVAVLYKRLERRLAGIYLATKVVSLAEQGKKIEVVLEGDRHETVAVDRVLVAIGRRPTSQGMGLENTNVRVNQQGFIEVDSQQRTADPHIWAIGDVVGQPMLAHKASHEGKVAVEALAGQAAAFDVQAIPAVVFTDPEIAWAGLSEEEAGRSGEKISVAQFPWAASGRATAVGRTDGLTKWVIEPDTDRLLGVGIVGVGAGELISEAVLAIEMGCTVRDLTETIHPHPTLSETLAFSGEVYLGTATEVYRPKRALSKS